LVIVDVGVISIGDSFFDFVILLFVFKISGGVILADRALVDESGFVAVVGGVKEL
jgi:hypothetical protein